MTQLAQNILKLRSEGKTYNEIRTTLGCSKGTISYHLGEGQKEKARIRTQQHRKLHPYIKKLETFKSKRQFGVGRNPVHKTYKLIKLKIETFFQDRKNKMQYQTPSFTVQDIIDKFGENPRCYLTGRSIDINLPRTYNFDHIIPASKGGENTLDNLGICTKEANQAKSDLVLDDFIQLCRDIVKHHDNQ